MRMLAGVQIPGPLVDAFPVHIKNYLYRSPMVITRQASARHSRVHFSSDDIHVTVRKSPNSDETDQQSLRALVESKCPALFSEFSPAWWLFNGHLQTVYCATGDFSKVDQIVYDRTYIRLKDGGTIGLDFTPENEEPSSEQAPVVVVLHGLTGNSQESYVRAILAPACAPVKEGGLGYRGVVVNFRGCGGVPITSPQLYSAGYTDDIRQAVFYIAHKYPKAPLLGVGFSLGANVLTRYIAEEGANCRFNAGCALACPWNLSRNNVVLNGSFVGKHVYSQGMGGNLLNLLKRHASSLTSFDNERINEAVANGLALQKPTMEAFDATFTRVGGGSSPPFPFSSADDYYVWSSSHKLLPDIRIPFLAINAADDPIVQDVPVDAGGNPWAVMVLSSGGGHLGWFEAAPSKGQVQRWVRKPALEWLQVAGELFVRDHKGQPLVEQDGFIIEIGREHLGCKRVDDVKTIENAGEGLVRGL